MLDEIFQNQIFCSILHLYFYVTAPEISVKLRLRLVS